MPSFSSVFPFTFSVPSFVTNFFSRSRVEPVPATPSPPSGGRSANMTTRRANPAAVGKKSAAVNRSKRNGYKLPRRHGYGVPVPQSAPLPSSAPKFPLTIDVPAAPVFRSSPPLAYGASPFPAFKPSTSSPINFAASNLLGARNSSSSPNLSSLSGPSLGSPWNPNTHNTPAFGASWTSSSSSGQDVEMIDSPESPTTVDLATELRFEEDDGTLPKGYIGTFRGNRLTFSKATTTTISSSSSKPECKSQLHLLKCGHWVATSRDEQCGANCHRKGPNKAVFACPVCIAAVDQVFRSKHSELERKELEEAWVRGEEVLAFGRLVQLGERAGLTQDITAAVMSYLRPSAARECAPASPPKHKEGALSDAWGVLAAAASRGTTAGNKRRRDDNDDEPEPVDPMDVDVVERRDPNKRVKRNDGGRW